MSFFAELKRRNVFKVAAAYIIVAWLLMQIGEVMAPALRLPDWVLSALAFFLILGFPVAMIFAWAFEMTPEGLKKEKDVDRSLSITQHTGRKLDFAIIGLLIVAVIYFGWDNFTGQPAPGTAAPPGSPTRTAESPKSIAVLPFVDLSQGGDQEWFADGLAEEILNALTRTPDLLVASRTSAFRYKGSELGISEIANELGVAHILEGSVRSSGERIRVTAQLIRANDGFHVWSDTYDRDEADMIAIQEDLAYRIAEALETSMDPESLADMTRVGTRSVEAYKAYLSSLSLMTNLATQADTQLLLDSIEQLEQATELDPRFSEAHYELALQWRLQTAPSFIYTGITGLPFDALEQRFKESIDQAIDTARNDTDRRLYQAHKAEFEMRLRQAQELYERVLEVRPNDISTWYAFDYTSNALRDDKLQRRVRSFFKERSKIVQDLAQGYVFSAFQREDPSHVADFGLNLIQRWPGNNLIIYQTHRALLWAGRVDEAADLARRYFQLFSDSGSSSTPVVQIRQLCAEGKTLEAQARFDSFDWEAVDNPLATRYMSLKALGQDEAATQSLMSLNNPEGLVQLADFLDYVFFDPRPYSELMKIVEREEIELGVIKDVPYRCPPPEQTSIAVLPFVNMSNDPENEFFSDGVSEEILNVLARIPELKVAARTSAFGYKDTDLKIAEIAHELGVNHVLEGSVRKAGNQVRVTAQLIKADDGFHLWSETYDRELVNIFAIQDEIADHIASALKVTLDLEKGASGNLTGTNSLEAYEHYLRGMALWHERTAKSLSAAKSEFESAVALDPDFAKGWAGLTLYWAVADGYISSVLATEAHSETEKAAARTLQLDPDNVEAMISIANWKADQLELDEAEALFRRALELNPSYATAWQWRGGMETTTGNLDLALEYYRRAYELDPRSRIIGYNYAYRLNAAGRSDEGLRIMQDILEYAPDFPDGLSTMMVMHILEGQCDKAEKYGHGVARVLEKTVDSTSVYLDYCQDGDIGRRQTARDTILSWGDVEYENPEHPSLTYAIDNLVLFVESGDFDATLETLDRLQDLGPGIPMWIVIRNSENAREFSCKPGVIERIAAMDKQGSIKFPDCD